MAVAAIGFRLETAINLVAGRREHELAWISDAIAALAVAMLNYLWLSLRVSRARISDLERAGIVRDEQLKIAAEIQRSLLPPTPAAETGYLWAARMEAAYEIGGDFYDFMVQDGQSVMVILGDVSGKGIPAALLHSSLVTLFREHAAMTNDPAAIAARISNDLHAETAGRPYATAIIARFDMSPRRATFVNAGHPAGVICRGSGTMAVSEGGPPLGLLADGLYASATFDLAPGDTGVMVTDGITEALDEPLACMNGSIGGCKGWPQMIPADICDQLLHAARAAVLPADGAVTDDRTVLAFRAVAGD
jgi:phosphoserine phosphatase RsbU/P